MGFRVVSRTHVGLVRKLNEDALLARPDRNLWAVADGMGGHHAGEVASAMVIEALETVDLETDAPQIAADAKNALQAVNARLLDLSRNQFQNRTIGSTVVAVTADESRYACIWAGDSRAYLLRNGEASQLTRDHSLVQSLVDAGMLSPEEAEFHPNANVITRAVGVEDILKIDSVAAELFPGDQFLIASDGLTRFVKADRLFAELKSDDLEAAADRLIDLAFAGGAPDNVSFVIVRHEPGAL